MADRGVYTYSYPRPAVSVDMVLFAGTGADLSVLLIRRKNPPFAGAWALPGGFVEVDESLDKAAARELDEETGLIGVPLRQLYTFGDPGRDPRGHTISVAYWAWLPETSRVSAGDDAGEAGWFPLHSLPELAFDHRKIIECGCERIAQESCTCGLMKTTP